MVHKLRSLTGEISTDFILSVLSASALRRFVSKPLYSKLQIEIHPISMITDREGFPEQGLFVLRYYKIQRRARESLVQMIHDSHDSFIHSFCIVLCFFLIQNEFSCIFFFFVKAWFPFSTKNTQTAIAYY